MSLLYVADILRTIFSIVLSNEDCGTYKQIRLACKRFKTILDVLDVRPLLLRKLILSKKRNKTLWTTLAEKIDIQSILAAPKRVQRSWFLVKPENRLQQLQEELFGQSTFYADATNKIFRYFVRLQNTDEGEDDDHMDVKKLWGCRTEYYPDPEYEQLLKLLQFYLGFDNVVKQAYKDAVMKMLSRNFWSITPEAISREL